MGVKYKKTNIAPWIAASNISSVSINAPDTDGPEARFKSMMRNPYLIFGL